MALYDDGDISTHTTDQVSRCTDAIFTSDAEERLRVAHKESMLQALTGEGYLGTVSSSSTQSTHSDHDSKTATSSIDLTLETPSRIKSFWTTRTITRQNLSRQKASTICRDPFRRSRVARPTDGKATSTTPDQRTPPRLHDRTHAIAVSTTFKV
jgi:hypothetical protein